MHGVLRTKPLFARTASLAVYVRRARLYAYSGLDLGRSAEEKVLSLVLSCCQRPQLCVTWYI
jgi:hypothetical protein